ncbi:hypothetical protein JTB14_032523 [Gonioctena quinquepunctata]|nr:hypothetical protein JTB14_032523 [Gonioctena quinquepunctata]
MNEKSLASGVAGKKAAAVNKNELKPSKQYYLQTAEVDQERTIFTNTNRGTLSNYTQRNKILIVAGHHGRDMAKFLLLQNEYEYMTQTILKLNCHPNILIDTAIRNSGTFTKKDIVIIWTERMTSQIRSRLIPNTTHTNLIVVTQPFRYDNEEMNDYIYSKNLQLKKTIHFKKLNTNILECNNILRKSNYNRNGYTITAKGKWYVCRAIWKVISTTGINYQYNQEQDIKRTHLDNNTRHELPKTLAAELQETIVNQGKEAQSTFLYPRLSQVAPKRTP